MLRQLWVASLVLLSAVTVDQQGGVALRADEPQVGSELQLTKVAGAGDTVKRLERVLLCDPVGGDHPYGDAACHDLSVASSDFDHLPGDPNGVCATGSRHYDPVTVSATGIWEGTPITFEKTYDNPCKLRLHTGPVFEF
ncbi:SSI family serine proteinase inhibitor [Kutzneria sp. CA-103260]|uniref:SSI family serine proteinase inhibitor n=1 Tax=Kutzneria sp. CA-103260 TaxID=2802641 RepID=UPI001BA8E707|nr:subtilase-type protease inhibitor [Kutzneria sp. CA-103260]